MRTPLALLVGPLLVGCTIGDSGPGTGGDDEGGAACGDGVQQAGEACDDGNDVGGDGCSATCSVESSPRLDAVIDKPTLMTELKSSNQLMVTLVGSGGFSGPVNLTASVVDANNQPFDAWTATIDTPTVNVPVDGSATAVVTLNLPSQNRGLAGTVKVDVSSAAGTSSLSSTVNVLNQVTFVVDVVNQLCVYPADAGTAAAPVPVTLGTKVRFYNKGAIKFEVHSDNGNAFPHQGQGAGADDPQTEPLSAYERTLGGNAGQPAGWYCHDRGPNNGSNPRILTMAP